MKEYLKKLPKEILNIINAARDTACKENMPVYLVGGFVRDLLLGVNNLDLDIVVEGEGIKFAERLSVHLKGKLTAHRRFGTATVSAHNVKIDIASARKETYPAPALLPVVTLGALKEDLYRRDFTINAMAVDLSCDGFSTVIDFFKGREDLKKKYIRILHDLSFIDDPTRILRAIRFETRYGFKIEPHTLAKLRESLEMRMLEKVAPHRLRDELILLLKEPQPLKVIRRLKELTGFGFISQKISLSPSVYGLLKSIDKEIRWFQSAHTQRRPLDAWLIFLMGLMDSLSQREASQICDRFGLRRGEEKRVGSFKNITKGVIRELEKRIIAPSRLHALLEPLSYEAILAFKAKRSNDNLQKHIEEFFKYYHGSRIHISGHDLNALGISPGPRYQDLLKKILNAKLDGKVSSREGEIALLKKLAKSR